MTMSLGSSIENENSVLAGSTSSNDNNARGAGEDIDTYAQMWQATAGVLAYVPRVRESVVYLPQGHIEQLEPYVERDPDMVMPIYDLPSKILCKVLDVKLRVNTDLVLLLFMISLEDSAFSFEDSTQVEIQNDEVFAEIALLPISEVWLLSLIDFFLQQEDAASVRERMSSARATRIKPTFYHKVLTPSDTVLQKELYLPKQIANECFPLLDKSQQQPSGEVIMTDLHGSVWRFRHAYRGKPKRHLLTTGWSTFVDSKKLVAGDICFFLRGRNGELRIGVRHSAKLTNLSPPVISRNTMQHGIITSVLHHVRAGTRFTVYYRPWTCRSCFILPLHLYLESEKKDYYPGKRFSMLFEDDAGKERRFEGAIIGVEDMDHIHWPGSKWRSIKVNWDPIPDEHSLPKSVSPWDVGHVLRNKHKQSFPLTPAKRKCISNLEWHPVIADGCRRIGVDAQPDPVQGVFQGQEATQNLWRDLGSGDPQTSSPMPTGQDSTTRPAATNPGLGVDNLLVLRIGQMNLECHDGKAPTAEDDDCPSSRPKEIKFFGFKLLEASQELSSQQGPQRVQSP
ncbi:hypothetical protein MLD38_033030 [Melastoma candidum]|uniref:Uncharacterized protein n=1 Tax=Melastoma candidum TaxID=119954 RepID=A0ACB9M5W1_9MYRT|nr:hypothetical protein MLD38_033030 [Melastoma candidum]